MFLNALIFIVKAEQLRVAESSKLKEETAKTEQLTGQLKEARSNLKKMEKKAKQDEYVFSRTSCGRVHNCSW